MLYAVEGLGKTSAAAYAPEPLFLLSETGYLTLLSSELVPAVPAEEVTSWSDLRQWLDDLAADSQGCKTLVLDALGGFERMCHEEVCRRDFRGEWGERGFGAYQRGYEVAVADWLELLSRLDRLHRSGMTVVLLGHARIQRFSNPLGADFDRYVCDVHQKTWAATCKWADAVLFGNFLTVVDKAAPTAKGKGVGGTDRVIYTTRRDAFDAKNRFGMPPELWLSNDPAESWGVLWNAVRKGNKHDG